MGAIQPMMTKLYVRLINSDANDSWRLRLWHPQMSHIAAVQSRPMAILQVTVQTQHFDVQADAAARLQALHALLDAALQPEESEALQVCVLEFVGDQVAAAVQSAAIDAKEPQQLLQRLIETSMVRTKVCSASAQCPLQHAASSETSTQA